MCVARCFRSFLSNFLSNLPISLQIRREQLTFFEPLPLLACRLCEVQKHLIFEHFPGTPTSSSAPDFLLISTIDKTLEIGIASWNAPPEKVLIYAGFRGFENEKIFEFSPSVLPIFQSGLGEDTTWRVVRVVEGATLEKSCAARHLGFESLTLRQPEKPVLPASLFYSRFPIPKPASIASAEITFELYSRCA